MDPSIANRIVKKILSKEPHVRAPIVQNFSWILTSALLERMAYQSFPSGNYVPQEQYQPAHQQHPQLQFNQPQQAYPFGSNDPYNSYTKPPVYSPTVFPSASQPYATQQPLQQSPVAQPVSLPPSYSSPTTQIRTPAYAGTPFNHDGTISMQYHSTSVPTDSPSYPQSHVEPHVPSSSQRKSQHVAPNRPSFRVEVQSPHFLQQPKPAGLREPTPQTQLQQPRKQNVSTNKRPGSPIKVQHAQQDTTGSKGSIDYHVLLLALADEYLEAAHSQGTTIALLQKDGETEEYYKLIATGLGCLEAVLKVILRNVPFSIHIVLIL